eukprot:746534-Pyramimonas_sp.AAC.1
MHLAAKSGSCAVTCDHCQVIFDRDGGGGGVWPAVRRPTRHNAGYVLTFDKDDGGRQCDMFPD